MPWAFCRTPTHATRLSSSWSSTRYRITAIWWTLFEIYKFKPHAQGTQDLTFQQKINNIPLSTDRSICALHHAPELHLGEVLGSSPVPLREESVGSTPARLCAMAARPHVPFLRPTQLPHRVPLHDLLRVYHPFHRLHHYILDANSSGGKPPIPHTLTHSHSLTHTHTFIHTELQH